MLTVSGYTVDPALGYDREANLWVADVDAQRVRIGYDPLGAEAAGDIVAISFAPIGTQLRRGDALATVEAAKFVGPLPAPIGGRVAAINEGVVRAPGTIAADPFGAWLAELDEVSSGEVTQLVRGATAITEWFAAAVVRLRAEGVIAQ